MRSALCNELMTCVKNEEDDIYSILEEYVSGPV